MDGDSRMTDQEEFEKWFEIKLKEIPTSIFLRGDKPIIKTGWDACAKQKNEIMATRFNEGLQLGLEESKRTLAEFSKVKEIYLNENEKLTNELLRLENVIEQQAKELAALRGFAGYIMDIKNNIDVVDVNDAARDYNLIDESGNPTKLLTGEK